LLVSPPDNCFFFILNTRYISARQLLVPPSS
jgi:hypothetical protein